MRAAIGICVLCSIAATSALCGADAGSPKNKAEIVTEYCKRVKEVPPADAEAHYQLGLWCRDQGLAKEADKALRTVIAIDSDHAGARSILGYVRYGTGWRKASEIKSAPRTSVKPSSESTGSASGDASSDPESGASERTESEAAGAAAERRQPSGKSEAGEESESEARSLEESELEKKKEWAAAAAEAFKTEFATFEDDDFLIHTTLPSTRQPRVQTLLKFLRTVKKSLVSLLGVKRSSKVWPAKVQFVVLRSKEEYGRFGSVIDRIDDAINPEGAYVGEQGHTALWKPTSEVVVYVLGETALDRLDGSDRWVGWWLKEGVSELLVAQMLAKTGEEDQRNHYKQNFLYSAEYLEAAPDDVTMYSLIETQSYPRRDRDRKRALAMTLVDFLVNKKGRKGFHSLVRKLKSDEAPAPPPLEEKEEFDAFYLSYISFQQETLETSFRRSVEKLETEWKAYIQSRAEVFQASSKESGSGQTRGSSGGRRDKGGRRDRKK